jgi:hypothetical protein
MYLPLGRNQNKFYKEPKKIVPSTLKNTQIKPEVPETEEIHSESFRIGSFASFVEWKDKKKKAPRKMSGG